MLADLEVAGQKPIESILPLLIYTGLSSPSVSIRVSSVEAIDPFIVAQPACFLRLVPPFLANLFALTSDSSPRVKKAIVASMNNLLSFWPEQILPHISNVVDYMLYCLKGEEGEDESLALLAAEFFLT